MEHGALNIREETTVREGEGALSAHFGGGTTPTTTATRTPMTRMR